MSKNKTIILIIILIVLSIITWFAIQKRQQTSTLSIPETDFTVTDTAAVDSIFIAAKDGRNNLFKRLPNGRWSINNKYLVRKDMIKMLLETMNQMTVKRPVSRAARNNVIKTIAVKGIKVEIYSKGELQKTFWVGGNTNDWLGSYFIMQGSENPYVVHIPGFNGFISGRFNVYEIEWRNRELFQSTLRTIQSLSVSYPKWEMGNGKWEMKNGKISENSFEIIFDSAGFKIEGVIRLDTTKLISYLNHYKNIQIEHYFSSLKEGFRDSLDKVTPLCIIKLVDIHAQNTNSITIYDKENDPDRMIGVVGKTNEIVSIQHFVFDKLMVKRGYFIKSK